MESNDTPYVIVAEVHWYVINFSLVSDASMIFFANVCNSMQNTSKLLEEGTLTSGRYELEQIHQAR